MTREEALKKAINIVTYFEAHFAKSKEAREDAVNIIEALEQEPCEDAISRQSLKSKLKEHHDFFVNAYGGFSNLPQNDKARVDEITNCIAMVVNEPPVNPQSKTGHWKRISMDKYSEHAKYWYRCDRCGKDNLGSTDWCPNCGCRMVEPQEGEK